MDTQTPIETMEHSDLPTPTLNHLFTGPSPSTANSAARCPSTSTRPPETVPLQSQTHMDTEASTFQSLRPTTPNERRNSRYPNHRIFCPVVGCPEASTSSNRHFRDFNSIRNHLNDHCTGHRSGVIPAEFLMQHNYSQCRLCNKLLHTRYHEICLKCRPSARTRERINLMRSSVNSNAPISERQVNLPSLAEVHEKFGITIKSIPLVLRRLWAQCLARAMAQAVWTNNEAGWIELQMLPKCTLCRPPRGGKSHTSQRLAWTRGRLQRWNAGERTELWQDLPQYKRPQPKKYSGEFAKKQRQDRCIAITSEGGIVMPARH